MNKFNIPVIKSTDIINHDANINLNYIRHYDIISDDHLIIYLSRNRYINHIKFGIQLLDY